MSALAYADVAMAQRVASGEIVSRVPARIGLLGNPSDGRGRLARSWVQSMGSQAHLPATCRALSVHAAMRPFECVHAACERSGAHT